MNKILLHGTNTTNVNKINSYNIITSSMGVDLIYIILRCSLKYEKTPSSPVLIRIIIEKALLFYISHILNFSWTFF